MYVSHWNSWAIRRHAGVRFVRGLVALALLGAAPSVRAQGPSTSTRTYDRSRDRGEGLPTSIFGTYVRGREFLVSPFYEHYRDRNYEYTPEELGFLDSLDYRGRYRANEGLLFLAYGITDDLAVEFEASGISASLGKAATDRSGLPPQTKESGLGDVEGQLRWRWHRETDSRPEAFSYVEYVIPHNRDKPLIGTAGWQWKFGTGVVRGYRWGTLTARAAVEYDAASSTPIRSRRIRHRISATPLACVAALCRRRGHSGRA